MDVNAPTLAQVPVLCIYTYAETGPHARHGVRFRGYRMVLVDHSQEIIAAFCYAMEKDRAQWHWRMGSPQTDIEFVEYLPANFQTTF